MSDEMYYDTFANEYVSKEKAEADKIAPPERYLLTLRGVEGVYVETYENNGERLDIAYTEADLQYGFVNQIRYGEAERHGWRIQFQTARMVKWCIPCSLFDIYYKRFVEVDE
ncbi:MAG: hypothetical protein IKU35_06675 [Bacteroidaceae bacterium]|nr:hypothetical protein [Bacteroidaceae bacterium]